MSAQAVTHQIRLTGGDADLAWSATGQGTPLLLIAGLGLDGNSWWRSIPGFAKRFRVITFDYRGVGRSGPARLSCTTDDLADDAVAVLDEAGVERILLYGFSLGGMVAQHLALRHPNRVSALLLGATQAGGPRAVPPEAATLAYLWLARFLSRGPPPGRQSPTCTGSAVAEKPRNASTLTWSSDGGDGSIPRPIGDRSPQP